MVLPRTLTRRELNRAALSRQLLLERAAASPAEAVEHLVGLHAQLPQNPYTALWSRVEDFDADAFSRQMEERSIVRISLQRSTIHTVTARDCLALRPVLQVPQDRTLKSAFGRNLQGVDVDKAAERAREMVRERPMTFAEIGEELLAEWPGSDARSLGMVARHRLPMVQVPPRGLWRQGGAARHTTAEHWLSAPIERDDAPDGLVMRYLAAFGPASVKDVQAWCGLTRLREVVDRHRDELVVFRDEDGSELFDLPDAPRPNPDTPAPPRFLPEFDNVVLGYKDRRRILPDEAGGHLWPGRNIVRSALLIDGFVGGTWALTTDTKQACATLEVSPFVELSGPQHDALATEAARFLAFHAPESEGTVIGL
ncbi:winged helix DNA-binding domain-containing protein [Nocardiopsis suaedae]|uniref:Winged helix DNA-binding domain-containing protein n=1 Tax=Nocardiopsis suaedae TaxID=3018444 RepID=A0ABT4TND8_9ACTN|nr:winged helix DNA-binding domain-containing protein [Nocardiopsis suaedae]MDA2805759.1 winged helix DNA-binding domain-containing protein [Nocardiopsis suaedae]